jgi:hypothetical protein
MLTRAPLEGVPCAVKQLEGLDLSLICLPLGGRGVTDGDAEAEAEEVEEEEEELGVTGAPIVQTGECQWYELRRDRLEGIGRLTLISVPADALIGLGSVISLV